jgi:alkylated DNA repair dioxygenase AlkB
MRNLLPYEGVAELYDYWLEYDLAFKLFEQLNHSIAWQREEIILFGRKIKCPRLTAFYGEKNICYRYSGKVHHPQKWLQELANIRERLRKEFGFQFNSVLCNYYQDHNDYMGWHSDNERELGQHPIIASLTLGASRTFQFRHKKLRTIINTELMNGSLLLMQAETQQAWQHRLPATKHACAPRINLTFRMIK